jgi:hypothetical protein
LCYVSHLSQKSMSCFISQEMCGVGQKVIPRPSADYFVVGRRQKVFSCVDIEAIKVAGTGTGHKRHK